VEQLEAYRREIDRIDGELVELFLKRMEVTGAVGAYKRQHGIPVLDPVRERQVIAAKTAKTEDPVRKADLAALYEAIMGISRRQQRRLVQEDAPGYAAWRQAMEAVRPPVERPRVAYQGEPGCYSEEAAVGLFGPEVERTGLPWFEDVFLALKDGRADYAVLPVENSSTGSIRQVYDLLSQYACYIVGEWQVKVEHCLVALPGVSMEDIRTVYSHEQGLMQCEKFLDAHRSWRRAPTLDTAGSAKQVAQSGDTAAAAICSRRAARLYGLNILAHGVNYNSANYTRFVAVAPAMELRPGRDTISLCFRAAHQIGSLHEVLTLFSVQGLNLQKLESRPIPGQGWEYLFFLEFTGDLTAPEMDGVLRELNQLTRQLRVLGNFERYRGWDNLVLTGMMGCGKSTVGKLLAQQLGLEFVDTDQLIEAQAGKTVAEIFATEGEAGFRDRELAIAGALSERKNLVVACGGGLPMRPECIASLKHNGRVIFLDRDGADIYDNVSMQERPLGQVSREAFLERWRQRLPVYRQWADHIVSSAATPQETAQAVLEVLK